MRSHRGGEEISGSQKFWGKKGRRGLWVKGSIRDPCDQTVMTVARIYP